MNQHNTINTPVDITALHFGRDMQAIPRRMEYQGECIDFIDRGLRATVRRGSHIAQIMTMTDGHRSFRLRSDNHGSSWTLLGIC